MVNRCCWNQAKVSRRGISRGRHGDQFPFPVSGKGQTGADVIVREVREIPKDIVFGHAGGQILQHLVDRNAETADAGFPAALARLDGDPVLVVHVQRYGWNSAKVNRMIRCVNVSANGRGQLGKTFSLKTFIYQIYAHFFIQNPKIMPSLFAVWCSGS